MKEPSADYLNSIFRYENGNLINLKKRGHHEIGSVAGHVTKRDYVVVTLDQKKYYAHRIVWVMHNGPIPEGMEIDHINRVRNDNRIENFRLVDHADQMKNIGLLKSPSAANKTGHTGVHYLKRNKKWMASLGKKYLGLFQTKEEAVSARRAEEKIYMEGLS